MSEEHSSRRTFIAATSGLALTGLVGATALGTGASSPHDEPGGFDGTESDADVTRSSYVILDGTEHATRVYVIEADDPGPTAMVVGGIHGDEEAGFRAAADVAEWTIDRGTLVVLPRANQVAIEKNSHHGEHGDLNRHFPDGERPTTKLARAIWGVVERHDPRVVVDLHSSKGLYDSEESGGPWGQAIFHSLGDAAFEESQAAAAYLNEHYIEREKYRFEIGPITPTMDPQGLLAGKVATDTDAQSFLVETAREGTTLETRVLWTKAAASRLLRGDVLLPESAENAVPTAEITTDPANAGDRDFEGGATVALDASPSTDPDGEIVEYAWDLDGDERFEATGPTAEVTLSFCGDLPVTLRVTDDDGATATETVVLSTA